MDVPTLCARHRRLINFTLIAERKNGRIGSHWFKASFTSLKPLA